MTPLEQIVYSTAMKTIVMYKYNSNQVYNNKSIKAAKKRNYNKQSKREINFEK